MNLDSLVCTPRAHDDVIFIAKGIKMTSCALDVHTTVGTPKL